MVLTRKQLLERLYAEFNHVYPYGLYTEQNRRVYFCRSSDRQMYLDIRHPENVPTERLQEIHDYIVTNDSLSYL
jgi:hypothetical protein